MSYLGSVLDGWYNVLTGLGTSADKTLAGSIFQAADLPDDTLAALYSDSALAGTIIDIYPDDALGEGPWFESATDTDTASRLSDVVKESVVAQPASLALRMARLFGGCLVMRTSDGEWLAIEKSQSNPQAWDDLGRPVAYGINIPRGFNGAVSAAEVLRIDGARTLPSRKQQRNGWDLSELQRCNEILSKCEQGWFGVLASLADSSQAVFKMHGFHAALSNKATWDLAYKRMSELQAQRSTLRAITIDEKDDLQHVDRTLTGIPETLDRTMMLLSMAVGVPVTRLFGRSAAGMNATGEGDAKNWNTALQNYRRDRITPLYFGIAHHEALARGLQVPADLVVKYPPLSEPTEAEAAQTFGAWASGFATAVGGGVLDRDTAEHNLRLKAELADAPAPEVDPEAIAMSLTQTPESGMP